MPSYGRPAGKVEVSFASQKRFIALYILRKDVLDRYRDRLSDFDVGKGAVRFADPEAIPFDIVRSMLEETARTAGDVC